jgi:hypothetical protein
MTTATEIDVEALFDQLGRIENRGRLSMVRISAAKCRRDNFLI